MCLKIFIFLLFNFYIINCSAQYKIDTLKFKQNHANIYYELSVKKEVNFFISPYIDSLKNNDTILPKFLEDPNFDMMLYKVPLCYNTYISLRYLIFENINDFKILNNIINSDNKKYSLVPDFNRDIPFKEYSFKQLAKIRSDYLLNKFYLKGSQ